MIEDKTSAVAVASYRSVSRNPVRFKALRYTNLDRIAVSREVYFGDFWVIILTEVTYSSIFICVNISQMMTK